MSIELLKRKELILRREYLRRKINDDFYLFFKNYHRNYVLKEYHQYICQRLQNFYERVKRRESPRLIINLPPRHSKSTIISETFPVWVLGKHQDWEVIVSSYSQTLASKFSRRAREMAFQAQVEGIFSGLELSKNSQRQDEWETSRHGVYKAVGIGSSTTGAGSHIFIIDDYCKDAIEARSETYQNRTLEWYHSVAETRLAPEGGVVILATRWNEGDLVGKLLESQGNRWELIKFPAIAEEKEMFREPGEALFPERFPIERLLEIKKAAPWVWDALYQQRPAPNEGNIVKREWIKYYSELPNNFDNVIQSWDLTFKETQSGSYVVGQCWGVSGTDYYLIDQTRGHWNFTDTLTQIMAFSQKHPKALGKLIEEKANGAAVINTLRGKLEGIVAINPQGSKEARLSAVSPLIQAGNVYFNKNAPYFNDLINELLTFPNGRSDDQVDCLSQALSYLFSYSPKLYLL